MTRLATHANRGQQLETEIETSNKQYNFKDIAKIQKIPTPVKVLDMDRKSGKITNAFYEKKSTVDYIGTYKGHTIVFDAKSTNVETRFDLKNIKPHQYQYLKDQHECGAIAFLIIRFKKQDEDYVLPFSQLRNYWDIMKNGGRKSIPYNSIAWDSWKIERDNLILLDYLDVVERMLIG